MQYNICTVVRKMDSGPCMGFLCASLNPVVVMIDTTLSYRLTKVAWLVTE